MPVILCTQCSIHTNPLATAQYCQIWYHAVVKSWAASSDGAYIHGWYMSLYTAIRMQLGPATYVALCTHNIIWNYYGMRTYTHMIWPNIHCYNYTYVLTVCAYPWQSIHSSHIHAYSHSSWDSIVYFICRCIEEDSTQTLDHLTIVELHIIRLPRPIQRHQILCISERHIHTGNAAMRARGGFVVHKSVCSKSKGARLHYYMQVCFCWESGELLQLNRPRCIPFQLQLAYIKPYIYTWLTVQKHHTTVYLVFTNMHAIDIQSTILFYDGTTLGSIVRFMKPAHT